MKPRTLQEWLQLTDHASVRLAACVLAVVLFSLVHAYKQFHGPATEATVTKLELGRSLAEGKGFTTRVHFPQSYALAKERGWAFPVDANVPSLDQAPLYSVTVGGVLAAFPDKARTRLFSEIPDAPQGTGADYVVLGLNLLLFWVALLLTYRLGETWFGKGAGSLAVLGLATSSAVWASVVGLDGGVLSLVLWLALAGSLARWLRSPGLVGAAGFAVCASLLFLADYSAWVLLPAGLLLPFWLEAPGARVKASLAVAGVLLAVCGFWLYRNIGYTGHPLGLAWQSIAAKAGDSTADPVVLRSHLGAGGYVFSLEKWGNKVLTNLRVETLEHYWVAGLCFSALFAIGWLYPYRAASLGRLRRLLTVLALALVLSQAATGSGEDPRSWVVVLTPLYCLFGAGFLLILLESLGYSGRRRLVVLGVVCAIQLVPMLKGVLEPRRLHFSYPPYYPKLFSAVNRELEARQLRGWSWICDVPAGAAWYGGGVVWAQPASLLEFYQLSADVPIAACVLTPKTLSQPFFGALANGNDNWQEVYRGLAAGHLPKDFPLSQIERFAPDLLVLVDGRAADVGRGSKNQGESPR